GNGRIRDAEAATKKALMLSRDCGPKQVLVKENLEKNVVVKIEEVDTDGDGILDKDDKCPNEPEDKDGFQDEDGCPDPDNDGDGIPDALDKCPNEPETFNGVDDDDGCPDVATGGKGQFAIPEKLLFGSQSARIDNATSRLLDEVAARLKRNPQVKVVRIEGHTDTGGSAASQQAISQQRAEAVRD